MPKLENENLALHYELAGKGEPVLLIMGITASHEVWECHSSVWSLNFHCIMPDNRGVGQSEAPVGDYSSEMMARDFLSLLDHLELAQVHVVGCSMGSTIAQQLALLAPERVKSLVLMCPWARCDAYAVGLFEHMVSCYQHLPPADFVKFVQLLIFDKSSWNDAGARAEFGEGQQHAEESASRGERQSVEGLKGQAAACIGHNTLAELARITAPTLILGGENDVFTPRWMAEEIHEALPNSELFLYPDAGHAFHFENRADFNDRVRAFLTLHS